MRRDDLSFIQPAPSNRMTLVYDQAIGPPPARSAQATAQVVQGADPGAPFQPEGTHLGFIAQEVQQVFPEWVSEDESGYLMLSMRGFEAVAVRGMQELQAENVALRAQAMDMRKEMQALRARMDAIESRHSLQP